MAEDEPMDPTGPNFEVECPRKNGSTCRTFTDNGHAEEALEVMNMLREHHQLCDVTLKVTYQDKLDTFYAHKVVLAAASPYFKAMFTGGLKECKMQEIPIEGVHPCVMNRLIEFAYTSRITLKDMTVLHVMTAAVMFQMTRVAKLCCEFLEDQLDPGNAIGIANFAQELGCKKLEEKAREFIYTNFCEVCESEEFMMLSACQLLNLINRDELNVRCESEVYMAAMRWVTYDLDERKQCIYPLLEAVRCHKLNPEFIKKSLSACPIATKNPECNEYLCKILQDLTLHKPMCLKVKQRTPLAPHVIFIAGGYLRQSLATMEAYNPEKNTWTKLADLPMPRSGLAAAVVHGFFYVIGGRNNSPDGNMDSNSLEGYNPYTNSWQSYTPMSIPRNRVGVGVIDDYIYAVGGSQGCMHHNTVEKYDANQDKWTTVAPMKTRRIGVGVAVLNRLLYAVGGFDGTTRLRSMECYHPENNEWQFVTSMNVPRSGAGVVAQDHHIYAIGGYDGMSQLNSVEKYDINANTWEFVSSMKKQRSALSVTSFGGKIYALGGYDGTDFLESVEVYDPQTNEWTICASMSSGRSGSGAAVGIEPCTRGPS
ncbi:kelch-like ECH-associated protein 1 [Branchiostoma lanceolatum]|uniref:KEAP1 protein n=1 Tax=Branchiostoma lanceolatum TaxID=7740 RepID=A0A8J9YYH7_BRALA|nr:KEAP1 [Branchiostoma lanceolatum]